MLSSPGGRALVVAERDCSKKDSHQVPHVSVVVDCCLKCQLIYARFNWSAHCGGRLVVLRSNALRRHLGRNGVPRV